jgi:hypothetical protein
MANDSSFAKEGFFSGEVEKEARLFHDRNTQYFTLYRRIASLGYKTISELQNNSRDVRRGIVTCLVIRTLSCYDAIRLCIEKGMEFETRVLLRSQLEAMYTVSACEKDKEFHKVFIKASTRDKHRILSRILQHHEKAKVYTKKELEQTVSDLKAKIDNKDVPKLLTKEIAQKAGMDVSYNIVYSFYSLAVHVNPVSLQEYLVWDDNVGIKEIVWGPKYDHGISSMLSSMNTMIVCLLGAAKIFNLNMEAELKEILKQWDKLGNKLKKKTK